MSFPLTGRAQKTETLGRKGERRGKTQVVFPQLIFGRCFDSAKSSYRCFPSSSANHPFICDIAKHVVVTFKSDMTASVSAVRSADMYFNYAVKWFIKRCLWE
jgi:hypothetical protein